MYTAFRSALRLGRARVIAIHVRYTPRTRAIPQKATTYHHNDLPDNRGLSHDDPSRRRRHSRRSAAPTFPTIALPFSYTRATDGPTGTGPQRSRRRNDLTTKPRSSYILDSPEVPQSSCPMNQPTNASHACRRFPRTTLLEPPVSLAHPPYSNQSAKVPGRDHQSASDTTSNRQRNR